MDLVASRAEFGRILTHERFHERAAMRFRIEIRQEMIERADVGILAGCDFMQRWIFDGESAVAHGAIDVNNGVAGCASQACMRFRGIDLLADGPIEASVEKNGVIVTAGAPLARSSADSRLHVFDRFSIELIVKRSEMVHRTFPLVVNIFVALTAGRGIHEKVGGNDATDVGLGGRWEKRRLGAAAFAIHGKGRGVRVVNAVVRIRRDSSIDVGGERKQHQHGEGDLESRAKALLFPCERNQRNDALQSGQDMDPKDPAVLADVAGGD